MTFHFDVVESDDLSPLCDKELAEIFARKHGVPLIPRRSAPSCTSCLKVRYFGQGRAI